MGDRNSNFEKIIFEVPIQVVLVTTQELLGGGTLGEDFDSEQGNEVALEVYLGDLGLLHDLLVSYDSLVVEKEQQAHLEGASSELMLTVAIT
jgi:hypothetical protein